MLKASPASKRVQQTGQTCLPIFFSATNEPEGVVPSTRFGVSEGTTWVKENPMPSPRGVHASVLVGRPSSEAICTTRSLGASARNSPLSTSKSSQVDVSTSFVQSCSEAPITSREFSPWSVKVSLIVVGSLKRAPFKNTIEPWVGTIIKPEGVFSRVAIGRVEPIGNFSGNDEASPFVPRIQSTQRIGGWFLESMGGILGL